MTLHLNQRSRLEPRPIRFVAASRNVRFRHAPKGRVTLADSSWRYFVIEANRDFGWKSFDRDPAGEAVVGTGIGCGTMIGGFGGPCPLPSCATATVVAVDVMSKRVMIVYFILILLGRSGSTRR
jgi:hypothetical protein